MPLLVISFLIFPFLGWGQNRVGNGGNVVTCPTFTRILDLYESEQELVKVQVSDEWEYANVIFSSIEKHSPKLAAQYKSRLQQIKSEIDFRNDVKLINVKDSENIITPLGKDCKVEQIAIRKNWHSSQTKKFIISKTLWDALDNQNKSALLSHEIIYEHFYRLGDLTSTKSRELNRWLYESRFSKISKKEFWDFIKKLELPIYQD